MEESQDVVARVPHAPSVLVHDTEYSQCFTSDTESGSNEDLPVVKSFPNPVPGASQPVCSTVVCVEKSISNTDTRALSVEKQTLITIPPHAVFNLPSDFIYTGNLA